MLLTLFTIVAMWIVRMTIFFVGLAIIYLLQLPSSKSLSMSYLYGSDQLHSSRAIMVTHITDTSSSDCAQHGAGMGVRVVEA